MIQPLGTFVMVQLDKPEKETAGGIIIPNTYSEPPTSGVVTATGSLCSEVKAGDTVLFRRSAGHDIGEDLRLLQESEILAVKE